MPFSGKIFGIGFHKTGTSSLSSALRSLGYRTIHGDPRGSWHGANEGLTLIKLIDAGDLALPTFDIFDAFVDNPYFTIWRQLDALFPNAKFIFTIRDESTWIESCARYYAGRRIRPMRAWMFGDCADPSSSESAKQAWLEAYRLHNAAVLAYFLGQKDRFLNFNVAAGDAWDKLCSFLDAPKPVRAFPHSNQFARGTTRPNASLNRRDD